MKPYLVCGDQNNNIADKQLQLKSAKRLYDLSFRFCFGPVLFDSLTGTLLLVPLMNPSLVSFL